MSCKPVDSRRCAPSGSETTSLAWLVTVECDNGVTHEVEVLLADVALASPSELTAALKRSNGTSAVSDALAADPTRVPLRITCSTEGCQPEYAD
jgi:hypothetical protein